MNTFITFTLIMNSVAILSLSVLYLIWWKANKNKK